MKSYVYIAGDPNSHIFKIGKSNTPDLRIKELRRGNPNVKLYRLYAFNSERHAFIREKSLHKFWKSKRYYGEWFKLENEDIELIDSILPQHKSFVKTHYLSKKRFDEFFEDIKPMCS